jgi:hypothetical protein
MELRVHSRCDKRQPPRNRTIGWRYWCGQPLRRATVRDESDSGIGLILQGSDLPAPGRTIQVCAGGQPFFRDAHVIRAINDRIATAHVGCRWKGVRTTPGHR